MDGFASPACVSATYKIGWNRGRRRIWLDGRRLTNSGFVGGTSYWCLADSSGLYLSLTPFSGGAERRVTGRADGKPVIDIVGRVVDEAFSSTAMVETVPGTVVDVDQRVLVRFYLGVITVELAD